MYCLLNLVSKKVFGIKYFAEDTRTSKGRKGTRGALKHGGRPPLKGKKGRQWKDNPLPFSPVRYRGRQWWKRWKRKAAPASHGGPSCITLRRSAASCSCLKRNRAQ